MNIQTPASKRNDPDTSYQAESRLNQSGKRKVQQDLAIMAVTHFPGMTSAELADKTGLSRPMLARRLAEVAVKGKSRQCAVNGTQAVTWHIYPVMLRKQTL